MRYFLMAAAFVLAGLANLSAGETPAELRVGDWALYEQTVVAKVDGEVAANLIGTLTMKIVRKPDGTTVVHQVIRMAEEGGEPEETVQELPVDLTVPYNPAEIFLSTTMAAPGAKMGKATMGKETIRAKDGNIYNCDTAEANTKSSRGKTRSR